MPITVKFDKNGFYHPVYGRMGRGRFAGMIYTLPDAFAEVGMLPATAEVIQSEDLTDELEDARQAKPIKPAVLNTDAYEKIDGGVKKSTRTKKKIT